MSFELPPSINQQMREVLAKAKEQEKSSAGFLKRLWRKLKKEKVITKEKK